MKRDEWFLLRNIVWEAAPPNGQQPADNSPDHPAVDLIRKYFAGGDVEMLDQAARLVALAKPGVDLTVASKQPWLVIDKS